MLLQNLQRSLRALQRQAELQDSDDNLSNGALAAIAISAAALLLLLFAAAFFFVLWRQRRARQPSDDTSRNGVNKVRTTHRFHPWAYGVLHCAHKIARKHVLQHELLAQCAELCANCDSQSMCRVMITHLTQPPNISITAAITASRRLHRCMHAMLQASTPQSSRV